MIIYSIIVVALLIVGIVTFVFDRGLYMTGFATPIVNSDIWDMELKFLSGVGKDGSVVWAGLFAQSTNVHVTA